MVCITPTCCPDLCNSDHVMVQAAAVVRPRCVMYGRWTVATYSRLLPARGHSWTQHMRLETCTDTLLCTIPGPHRPPLDDGRVVM